MKLYSKLSTDVLDHIARIQDEYHPNLTDVTLEGLFVFDDEQSSEPVLKHQGYAAAATIKITSVKDRALGGADAVMTIDRATWAGLSAAQKDALIDHELYHLEWLHDNEGKPKSDVLGRPKLGMRRHDLQIGFFAEILKRHGDASFEAKQTRQMFAVVAQMDFDFQGPQVTMTHGGETVNITATLARMRGETEPAAVL
jgi:hypothetical protein